MLMHNRTGILLALVLPAALAAQATPQLTLGRRTDLPGVEFSRITDVRELADGRLLVTDAIDKQLYVVDFAKQTSRTIGRQGAGPGEYRMPGRLLAISRDSTLLVDNAGGRWLVMVRDSFVDVVTSTDPAMAGGRLVIGADGIGSVLTTRTARSLEAAGPNLNFQNDSSYLLRVRRKSGSIDTLVKIRARPAHIEVKGPSDNPTSVSVMMNPITTGEQAVPFPDGAIAVARLDPYRVDWIIGSRHVLGKPLPFETINVTRDEKVAVLARSMNAQGKPLAPEDVTGWPEVFPPFPASGMLAAPDGNLWIRRAPTRNHPATDYDIVDRTGKLVGRLHLPSNEVIAGIGRASLFVIQTDSDDVQHLERYARERD
jgi:hypothetical protein